MYTNIKLIQKNAGLQCHYGVVIIYLSCKYSLTFGDIRRLNIEV